MSNRSVGGQAVINGIMFREKENYSIAIRKENNQIATKKGKINIFKKYNKIFFLRGILNLIETLYLGVKALNWSAAQIEDDPKKEEKDKSKKPKEKKESPFLMIFSLTFSIAFAIAIFKIVPFYLTKFLTTQNQYTFSITEGLIKLTIFILYIYLISFMKDIKILYQYHGAEHKLINCYEHKEELTVKNIKKYSTLHSRCGTSFLFLVIFISIIFYMFIPNTLDTITKIVLRILLLPVIAGVSYEIIKTKKLNFLSIPGKFIQKITTSEPNEKQIEVAIKAFNILK